MIRGAPSGMDGLKSVARACVTRTRATGPEAPNLLLALTVDSTQRWARAVLEALLAEDDEPAAYCCGALEQTAGRGRNDRSWSSRSGGVYATLVTRLRGEAELQALPARVAVALAGVVNPVVGGTCRIKWPNDLVVGRRKIAGILVDAITPAESAPWALIGFGVNHSQRDFGEAREVATSLAEEVGLRLPFFEEMPLAVQEISALLEALGHPTGQGALSLAADPREGEAARREFAAKANAALHAVPPYGAWLRQVLGA